LEYKFQIINFILSDFILSWIWFVKAIFISFPETNGKEIKMTIVYRFGFEEGNKIFDGQL